MLRKTLLLTALIAAVGTPSAAAGTSAGTRIVSVYTVPGHTVLHNEAKVAERVPIYGGEHPSGLRVVAENTGDTTPRLLLVQVTMIGPGFIIEARKRVYGLRPHARADVLIGRLADRRGKATMRFDVPAGLIVELNLLPHETVLTDKTFSAPVIYVSGAA